MQNVGLGAEARLHEALEQGDADTGDYGEHEQLNARGDDVPENALGHEGGSTKESERQQDEARQCHQLEFQYGDEDLHREDEEGQDDNHPGDQQDQDLHEVGEEPHGADQIRCRIEQGFGRVEPGRRDHAGAHEVADRHRTAARLQT